jgi:hypothetical protein
LVLQLAAQEYNPATSMAARIVQTVGPRRRFAAAPGIAALLGLLALAIAAPLAAEPAPKKAPAPEVEDTGGCNQANLIKRAVVTAVGLSQGRAQLVQDGLLATEGTVWNAPSALQLKDTRSQITVDLRQPRELRYFALQGDNNDTYSIEGSLDGLTYKQLWLAPITEVGMGLRTRWVALPNTETARYLRVRAVSGDSYYTLSELRAYCQKPNPWPLALTYPPKVYGWKAIDNDVMVWIKGWAAAAGTLILIGLWAVKPTARKTRRALDVALALVGIFGFFSWWNLGHFHFDHYVHIWEHYHYYMGAKYGPELRYSRLYECTAAADLEDGLRARVKKRLMRDLATTNELGKTDAIVADPTICTKHFTPERWQQFRADNRFFRSRFSLDRWDESQTDHGYNGTPVWAVLGRLIADYGPTTVDKIDYIAAIDSGLLALMWIVALWAFGWRPVCVALMWWGFNFPARFYWNGGSMLRYDWLLWIVVGICLLKKRYHFAGGMALTYSTLLRIFPGFIVAALVLKALARMVRHRRLVISRAHLRFAAGCVVAMAILLPAGAWATGGYDAWPEFVHNSKKHLHTALTNNMGLKTVLGYDPGTSAKYMRDSSLLDPFTSWKHARLYFYAKRAPIYYALILLFCIALARAGDREPDWAAACYGAGFIAITTELTCYYYGFLLAYGLLWERRKLPGVLATALAAVTCYLPQRLGWNDDHFTAMSLYTSLVVILVTVDAGYFARPRLSRDEADDGAPERKPDARTVAGQPSAESPFTFDNS